MDNQITTGGKKQAGSATVESKSISFEVLPPAKSSSEAVMRRLARVMDDLVRVPGTKWRIGLDPIVGLVPGLGDGAANLLSAAALVFAARGGLPKLVLLRMALNVLINGLFGMIPIFGDMLSFWFKSNRRNYMLLTANIGKRRASRGDLLFVVGVFAALILILALIAIAVVVVWAKIWGWLFVSKR
jgi:hypothetical protein